MSEEQVLHFSVDRATITKLVGGALYPTREDALLEVVKNADDAILLRRAREEVFDGRIMIWADRTAKTLSVTDNGAGITAEEFQVFVSRIGASLQHVARSERPEPTARQWAAGFLGFFMLADRTDLVSRPPRSVDPSLSITLDQSGAATLSAGPEEAPAGTTVRLRLRRECFDLLERAVLEDFVRERCAYVASPIYLDSDREPLHAGVLPAAVKEEDEAALLGRIEGTLRAANVKFDKEPAIGGLRPDFIAYGPQGQAVIVEAKTWPTETETVRRAVEQVFRYKEATGIDSVLMVLGTTAKPPGDGGVVGVEGLVEAIENEFRKPVPRQSQPKALRKPRKTVFAAMPFSAEYDDVFFVAMAYAAEKNGSTCVRVDREEFSGEVVEKIRSLIRESAAVICDLSDARPNVLYEAGFAHALEKPTIHICSTPLGQLPFDVRNWNTLAYAQGRTVHLREALAARLRAVLR